MDEKMKKVTMLVGITKGVSSKTGSPYAVLQLTKPYSARQLNDGCRGCQVFEEFVSSDLLPLVDKLAVGKPVNIEYEVSRGRAFLAGFSSAG